MDIDFLLITLAVSPRLFVFYFPHLVRTLITVHVVFVLMARCWVVSSDDNGNVGVKARIAGFSPNVAKFW